MILLHDYWRSSASYRVRIALELKGLDYTSRSVDLVAGDQRSSEHRALNPQGTVPVLEIDGERLTQSLAIIEYLDATRPEPRLIPSDPPERARATALAHALAVDVHPVCNLHVVAHHVRLVPGDADAAKVAWMRHFITKGLAEFEAMLPDDHAGDPPGLVECCLVPQLYNARRWGADLAVAPHAVAIAERCEALSAFAAAHPDRHAPRNAA